MQHWFAGLRIDRCADGRDDPELIERHRTHQDARYVPVLRTANLVVDGELVWLTRAQVARVETERDPILLGVRQGVPWFAVPLTEHAAQSLLDELGGRFGDLRFVASQLDPEMAAVGAYARALTYWQHRHRFCGVCGSPNRPEAGGTRLVCTASRCGRTVFPRVDPAMIVLVHDGADRCLLGRQANWPDGLYSTLAGFVEPGESLEETVRREVMEEAGVAVGDVAYHSSQPWPFPSSLMVGFHARAESDAIQCGPELQHARWFTRDEIPGLVDAGKLHLPREVSISRVLVDDWLRGRVLQ